MTKVPGCFRTLCSCLLGYPRIRAWTEDETSANYHSQSSSSDELNCTENVDDERYGGNEDDKMVGDKVGSSNGEEKLTMQLKSDAHSLPGKLVDQPENFSLSDLADSTMSSGSSLIETHSIEVSEVDSYILKSFSCELCGSDKSGLQRPATLFHPSGR